MEEKNLGKPVFIGEGMPKGVRYLISKKYGKPERVYYIKYRTPDGRQHFEKVGRQFDRKEIKMTPAKAAAIRFDRMRGKELPNEDRRTEEKAAKEAEEGRWTFNKLWEAWKADPENKGKRGTYKADQRYRRHLKEPFGDREPLELKPLDVDRLRLSLAEDRSRETTISVLSLIRRISRYAASKDICPGLSFPIILRGKKLGSDPKEKRVPNEREIAAYIKTCREWPDPQAGNFQLFILYTGIRNSSARNLKWEDVDQENHTALLRDSKTGDVQIVLSDDAVSLLKAHPGCPPHGATDEEKGKYIFTGKHPEGGRSKREVERIPAMIRDAAGLPEDMAPCHTFRRYLATRLDEEGVSQTTIMRLGGWKTPAMVVKYTKTQKETLREAANLLGRKIGEAEANGKT
jgi:integrase